MFTNYEKEYLIENIKTKIISCLLSNEESIQMSESHDIEVYYVDDEGENYIITISIKSKEE